MAENNYINPEIVFEILQSSARVNTDFPGQGDLNDMLNFGFSYVEHKDNYVSHIVTNPKMMKQIIATVSEATIDPRGQSIGRLWTADLIVSHKIKRNHIVFSNIDQTAVLDLNTHPNREPAYAHV